MCLLFHLASKVLQFCRLTSQNTISSVLLDGPYGELLFFFKDGTNHSAFNYAWHKLWQLPGMYIRHTTVELPQLCEQNEEKGPISFRCLRPYGTFRGRITI